MTLLISDQRSDAQGISAEIDRAGRVERISIRSDDCEPSLGDALACTTLLMAMASGGGELTIPAEVSDELLSAAPRLVEIFRVWMGPGHERVTVRADRRLARDQHEGTAAFFSGGADSFHTVLSHLDELDALIFVRGFDLPIEGPITTEATEKARAAAGELGIPLIEVDASLRDITDTVVHWEFAHASLLAATAHTLGRAGTVLIPATLDYRQFAPWGSHPATDPLWSSDAVRFAVDGVETTRLGKFAVLAQHDVALRHLRVCYDNGGGRWSTRPPNGPFNCGRCAKCLEAILSLHLVGALDRCPTLPHELVPRHWSEIPPVSLRQVLPRTARSSFKVGKLRDLLERAEQDATVPGDVTEHLRRLLRPLDRLEEDPAFLDRALDDEAPPPVAAASAPPTPVPAGYRLVDAACRVLDRTPRIRDATRRVVRGLARRLDGR